MGKLSWQSIFDTEFFIVFLSGHKSLSRSVQIYCSNILTNTILNLDSNADSIDQLINPMKSNFPAFHYKLDQIVIPLIFMIQ